MDTLFISDLHLHNDRPEKIVLFRQLLKSAADHGQTIYILGDLFEAWAGDDDVTPPHQEIIDALAGFTASGHRLFFMRGNRDYLAGKRFTKKTGASLINDPALIEIMGKKVLLMHGDTLCSLDKAYQIFRKLVNNPVSINLFLLLPFRLRHMIWHGLRNITKKNTLYKSKYITDVYQPVVEKVMLDHEVNILIHGHTHKPDVHGFLLFNNPSYRYVLGDWYNNPVLLAAGEQGFRLLEVRQYLEYQA